MYSFFFVGTVAFLLSLLLTPLVRNLSRCWGGMDQPDQTRKVHKVAVPRVGGIAIAIAYVVSFVLLAVVPLQGGNLVLKSLPIASRLLPAALLIFATGFADDLFTLKPWHKLAGQIIAAVLAFWAGIQVHAFVGHPFGYWLSLPLTIVWLIACTNSFNLIDGVDGLAAGVGLFATCTMLIASFSQHNVPLALATAPLAGALLGFLRYNFNPATIFLGDSGSLLLGFLLGCYGVVWSQKSATILGMTAPLMALSIPLLDTALAIVRRFLRQRPIFGADRGHIHHRLLDRGLTPRKTVLMLYGCCAIGALCSLAMAQGNFSELILIVFCLITWIGTGRLGYIEFGVARRMVAKGTFRRLLNCNIVLHGFEKELVAAQTPDACWSVIYTAAKDFGFHHLEMCLAGRRYECRNDLAADRCWNVRIPISDRDYIELTHEFDSTAQAAAIAPFADVLRRALELKLMIWAGRDQTSARTFTGKAAEIEIVPSLSPHPTRIYHRIFRTSLALDTKTAEHGRSVF
jgi:UDP-GlcNAc:undecaprenyl-phosphate/decaprenyl-phosphate GlcNAc-1-phosphate transferase